MTKRIKSKIMAIILTLAMVVSLMPAMTLTASAAQIGTNYGYGINNGDNTFSSINVSVSGSIIIDQTANKYPIIELDKSVLGSGSTLTVGGTVSGLDGDFVYGGYYYYDGTKYPMDTSTGDISCSTTTSVFSYTISVEDVQKMIDSPGTDDKVYVGFYSNDDSSYSIDSAYYEGNTAPTISDKTITSSSITQTGVTLSWNKAIDDTSAENALQYLVYRSGSNNLDSVTNIETNGTAVGTYTADIATKDITGLTAGTTYYFNVIVKDEVGNKTCYTIKSVTTPATTTPFSAGDGTAAHPYEISTAEQLYFVRDYLDCYFKQTADITIDTATYPSWSPIGTTTTPFTGSYDGNSYKIKNLKINTTASSSSDTVLGLFGVAGSSAVLDNIKLENVDIDVASGSNNSVQSFIGGIAGINYGTISNCSVTGTIDAASTNIEIGGLVGCNGNGGVIDGGDISDCTSDCTINATVNYQQGHIGGLVGASYSTGSTITNSSSSGTVNGIGGSSVNQTGVFSGGLIGYASDTTITDCSSDCTVSALNARSQAHAGGLIGGIVANCSISNCSSTGGATAGDAVGSTGTKVCAGGLIGYSFSSSVITNSFSTGDATATGTGSSTSTSTYSYAYSGGFLGYISAGSSAVNVSRCYSTGNSNATVNTYGYAFAGGFGGCYLKATVSKCFSTGNAGAAAAAGGAYTGGFLGSLQTYDSTSPSTIANCYSTGNASADCVSRERAGGLLGTNELNSTISYCYSAGVPSTVQNVTSACGGLIAISKGTVSNSYYDGTVSGKTDTDRGTPMATSDMKKASFITSLTNSGATWKLVSNLNDGYPILDGVGEGTLPTCAVTYKDSIDASMTYGTDTVAQSIIFSLLSSISPTKSESTLSGWYTDSSCGSDYKWDFGTKTASTGALTLYAGWETAADMTAPSVSDKIITASDVTQTGVTLSWNKAMDDTSAETVIQYLIYRSGSNNLDSVTNIEDNGTAVGTYTADIATKDITGLTAGTTYYFNVIVKDEAGNKTGYTAKSVTTSVASSSDATLKASSTVKGQTVSLGTPNATLGLETAGTVNITAAQAANTNNTGTFITLFDKNDTDATVKVVKYASGASTTNFETDADYANQAITNGDFFIIRVTAQDTATVKYYRINVTVTPAPSSDAGLTSVLNQTITAASEAGTSGAPKTAIIGVANSVSTVAATDIVKHDAGATVTFYGTNGTFVTSAAGSVNLTAGAGTDIYIKVVAADNTTLYYKVTINRAAASSSSGTGSSTKETPSSQGASVIVNGQTQTAGTTATATQNGQTVTTVTVDTAKLEKVLEAKGDHATVTIPVTNNSDVAIAGLTGQMVKNMEEKEATLEVKTGSATYTLPASEIDIDSVSKQLGENVTLSDVKVQIEIAEPSAALVKVVENAAKTGDFTIMVSAVEFAINCTYNGKTVDVSSFNSYIERTVAIPDGVDPTKITTGVVVSPDGTVRHVPTQVIQVNSKYYAKINSLTNSTYTVVWNPVTFTDVANHWAEDAINNMGSRMVVTGVGNGNYKPNNDVTRAEFAAIVVRALGLEAGTGENKFSDVKATDWFCGYVETASKYGIINGYNEITFAPNAKITREQAMTMIYRAMKITGLEGTLTDSEISALLTGYTDSTGVASYAKSSIASCLKTGVVSGTSSNTLAPKNNITRAEVAVIVERLLKKSELI